MKCTCARCGKEFEAVHKTSVCIDCKIQKCIICGEEFELKWPYTAVTCSSKCRGIYRKESGIGKEVAKKASETLKMKHGVSNASKIVLKPRKCAYCGKEFIPSSNRQKYCKDNHYGPCPVCGKPVLIKDMSIGPQACSEQCRQEAIRRTCLERYGCETAVISDHARELSKQTCMRKYGVDHYSKTDEYHEKFKKTSIERFGVDVPMKNSEVQQKAKDTNNERYGGNSPMCSEDVKAKAAETVKEHYGGFGLASFEISDKIRRTNLERYGDEVASRNDDVKRKAVDTSRKRYGTDYPTQSKVVKDRIEHTNMKRYGVKTTLLCEEVRDKAIQTWLSHYGVDNPFKSEFIQDRIRKTLIGRYEVDNPMKSDEFKLKAMLTNKERYGAYYYTQSDMYLKLHMTDPSKIEEFKAFRLDVSKFIVDHHLEGRSLKQLADIVGVDIATISSYVISQGAENLIRYTKSNMEDEVYQFLLDIGVEDIRRNDRLQIFPNEIDLYSESHKIGIECNPTYTHNSSKPTHWNSEFTVPKTYHQNKTELCNACGIYLIHLFGCDWNTKQNICKSMIRNAFGKSTHRYYARKLNLRNVSHSDSVSFLNTNHIQGSVNSSVRLGLYQGNELISLMTFSKSRYSNANGWVLSRFCTKLNSNCVGGASKLFKHFVDKYSPSSIVSFSDMTMMTGTVYEILKFHIEEFLPPTYRWVNTKTDVPYNRENFQKSEILKKFDDVTEADIFNHTEKELMEDHGYVQVYGSGMIKWIWNSEP